jgi:hypothetical protein
MMGIFSKLNKNKLEILKNDARLAIDHLLLMLTELFAC